MNVEAWIGEFMYRDNIHNRLVDMYFSEYVLMYTVKLVHLLLLNVSERNNFCA